MIIKNLRHLISLRKIDLWDVLMFWNIELTVWENFLVNLGDEEIFKKWNQIKEKLNDLFFLEKYYWYNPSSVGHYRQYDFKAAYRLAYWLYTEALNQEWFKKGDSVLFLKSFSDWWFYYSGKATTTKAFNFLHQEVEYKIQEVKVSGDLLIENLAFNPHQFLLINNDEWLPLSFVVLREESHPLWNRYVDYIKEKTNIEELDKYTYSYLWIKYWSLCLNANEKERYTLTELLNKYPLLSSLLFNGVLDNFIISTDERDKNEELWNSFIDWLNKKFNNSLLWRSTWFYWIISWSLYRKYTRPKLSTYKEIALKEWEELISSESNTKLKEDVSIKKTISKMNKKELYELNKELNNTINDKNYFIELKDKEIDWLKWMINSIKDEKIELEKNFLSQIDELNNHLSKIKLENNTAIFGNSPSAGGTATAFWKDVKISESEYKLIKTAFDNKIPMLFKWPSWCGKTTKAKALAGDKLVVVDCNDSLTNEDLLWNFILKWWETIFVDWLLTDAVRNWKTILLNEINSLPTWLTFLFNWLTELKNWKLWSISVTNNQEVVEAHPDFRIIWTLNKDYLWTRDFWMSFLSRFISVDMTPMSEEDEYELLSSRYPSINSSAIKFLVKLESSLREDINFTYDISTRDLDLVLILMQWWLSLEDALTNKVYSNLILDLDKQRYNIIFDNLKKEYAWN